MPGCIASCRAGHGSSHDARLVIRSLTRGQGRDTLRGGGVATAAIRCAKPPSMSTPWACLGELQTRHLCARRFRSHLAVVITFTLAGCMSPHLSLAGWSPCRLDSALGSQARRGGHCIPETTYEPRWHVVSGESLCDFALLSWCGAVRSIARVVDPCACPVRYTSSRARACHGERDRAGHARRPGPDAAAGRRSRL